MKRTIAFLLLTAALVMADDKKSVTIQTPSGELSFEESIIPNQKDFNDTITGLKHDELSALERDTKRVPTFIAAFVSPEHRTGDTLEDLDLAFAAWLHSGSRDAFTANDVIRIVGCALGAHAIQHLGVCWARVTDAHGSDIALVAEPPLHGAFLLPPSGIASRTTRLISSSPSSEHWNTQ